MITIWHNPRCSKSRQTLALVEEKGDVTIRKYLEDAPTVADIQDVLAKLQIPAIDLIRVKDKAFKELGLSKNDPEADLIAAMAANPILIERPVVLSAGKAALGRPPEQVLDIL